MPEVYESWHGDEILQRAERAVARSDISIAEQIGALAKGFAHVETGTLKRSIHAAAVTDQHSEDQDAARGEDLQEGHRLSQDDVMRGTEVVALCEVGSWIAYACVEETGRHHEYMHPAKEIIASTAGITVHAAFAEEGLT